MLLVDFLVLNRKKAPLWRFFIVWDLVVEGDNKLNPTQW
ncbi:hypothetical protein PUND_a1467 [Pseudoalteromonas undina]|nr:hypothetical protein PUND_a1467 [Pseudoalteromonas undina]GAA62649.1 hypothetical protein P20311_0422 [Pseudoalteromonas sp. BSi20311]